MLSTGHDRCLFCHAQETPVRSWCWRGQIPRFRTVRYFDHNSRFPSPKKTNLWRHILFDTSHFLFSIPASKFTPVLSPYKAILQQRTTDRTQTFLTMFTFDPKGSGYEFYFEQWEPALHFQSHDRSVSSEEECLF